MGAALALHKPVKCSFIFEEDVAVKYSGSKSSCHHDKVEEYTVPGACDEGSNMFTWRATLGAQELVTPLASSSSSTAGRSLNQRTFSNLFT